jgi:hypothetical protein
VLSHLPAPLHLEHFMNGQTSTLDLTVALTAIHGQPTTIASTHPHHGISCLQVNYRHNLDRGPSYAIWAARARRRDGRPAS